MIKSMSVTLNGKSYPVPFNAETGEAFIDDILAPLQPSGMNRIGEGPGIGEAARSLGFYPVTVVAVDCAGNKTVVHYTHPSLGLSCKLQVYEDTSPGAHLVAESGVVRENTFPVRFSVSDSGSGIKINSCRLTLNDEEIQTTLQTDDEIEYTAEYLFKNLADGEYSLKLHVEDWDGNSSEDSVSFTVDKYHTVKFVSDGEITEQTILHGECAETVVPEKKGYAFLGWYRNGVLFDFSTPILCDAELVARWKLMDNRSFLLQLLREEWVEYNAPRPAMAVNLNVHTADARYSILEARQLTEIITPVGLGYITQDRKVAMSVTIRGSDHTIVMAQANETVRCLQARRRDPRGGFDLLKVEGITNVENGHNYSRITIDCTLLTFSENID